MMRGALSVLVWAVFAGSAWPVEPSATLRIVDDRGERVEDSLTVCFQTGLRQECQDVGPGDALTPPARFQSLRAEGPGHGPVSLRQEELAADAKGRLVLRVPRKAHLKIDHLPAEPLSISVYDPQTPSFDKPLLNVRSVGPDGIEIPAGEFLVSLSSARRAPDLHWVSAGPAVLVQVEYQPKAGWSLVLRCRGEKAGQPLKSAVVSVESVPGYGLPNRSLGESTTGGGGLALFSGLEGRTVTASVRHAEFLPKQVQGIAAVPGSLSFREVVLEEGGAVRARVTVNGSPRDGLVCRVLDFRQPISPDLKSWKPAMLYEGRTDREGICRTAKLPAGSYLFTVSVKEGQGLERAVTVTNGLDGEEEFAFSEIRVSGKVSRGNEAAPGFLIRVLEAQEDLEMRVVVAQATTGEDGTYELTLWKPGRYLFGVFPSSAKAPPAIVQNVALDGEAKTLDFALGAATIHGKVVDDRGHPLEAALVKLRWNVSQESALRTNERGEFEFFLDSAGQGEVTARKEGYEESRLYEVKLADETELSPLVVVLGKAKLFRGTVSSSSGSPVAGAWVGAVRSRYGDEEIRLTFGRTDGEGRFEVAPVAGARNRLFASGPGCPLSFFEPLDESGELALRCQGQPAVLELTVRDAEGRPMPNVSVILRYGSVIIPSEVLFNHLALLGLRAETDASGRLVVPNLAAGDYDVFLSNPVTSVNEGMIEVGSRTGLSASAHLAPLATSELQLSTGSRPPGL
jgi:hypothetical protein